MPISMQTDSDGHEYQIWGQEQVMSCVIASIWMARGMARQTTFDESEWEMACRLYESTVAGAGLGSCEGPQTFDSGQHANNRDTFGSTMSRAGFNLGHVVNMLRQEGFIVTQTTGRAVDFSKISPTKPAIAIVIWRSNASGSWQNAGGHAIVVAGKNSNGQVVYLDPGAGGRIRELPNNRIIPHPNRSVTGVVQFLLYLHDPNV